MLKGGLILLLGLGIGWNYGHKPTAVVVVKTVPSCVIAKRSIDKGIV